MIVEPLSIDPLDLVEPARFARNGYPHDVWTRLRAEAPVAFFDPPGFESFWAITKHADIADISSQPTLFSNAHGLFVGPEGSTYPPSEMVVTIDPPQHGPMRRVAIRRFTPRAIRSRLPEIDRIAVEVLDELVASDDAGEFDFVERVAAPLPIGVISWLLGVPRSDWDLLFRWTNEIIGKDDPEFQRPGETPDETIMRARIEMHTYLGELIAQRRNDPRDDVVTELIAAEIDGEPLTQRQLLSYCELIVEAGNETTRNAITGGLLAFSEYPGEWERLRGAARAPPHRGRRDPPVGQPDHPLHAYGDGRHRGPRGPDPRGREGRVDLRVGEPRRGRVRRPVHVPDRPLTEPAPRVRHRRSTSAWARTSPGSRWRRSSATCSTGSSPSRWRARSTV